MKRSELTAQKMKDMGWVATFEEGYDLPLKDIVFNIQSKNEDGTWFWKLRCIEDKSHYVEKDEYTMCAHYKVYYRKEYLEVSTDGNTWYNVAVRDKYIDKKCVYAD